MNKKYLTPEEINARLRSTRDQKFRTKTEEQLLGRQKASISQKLYYQNNPDAKKRVSKNSRMANLETYSRGTYIVRSPGNDLLDFYDMMHKRKIDAPKSNITPIPPSRIFEFRFRTELPNTSGANQFSGPTQVEIYRNVCKPYADNHDSKKVTIDKKVLYKWLVDKPSVQKEFKLAKHAVDYLSKLRGSQHLGLRLFVHTDNQVFEDLFWKGPLAGYSIIFIPEKVDF